ncbi:hypothetical protein PG987_015745 [Apiospora arundinis]
MPRSRVYLSVSPGLAHAELGAAGYCKPKQAQQPSVVVVTVTRPIFAGWQWEFVSGSGPTTTGSNVLALTLLC